MRHARSDYNHIQDSKGKIPDDEPVFLLRGQDAYAPYAIQKWADKVEKAGGKQAHLIANTARSQAIEMEEWQKLNVRKLPDMPAKAAQVGGPVVVQDLVEPEIAPPPPLPTPQKVPSSKPAPQKSASKSQQKTAGKKSKPPTRKA